MANEFIARKGIISLDSIQVTGSITATGGITISGSISSASFATTAATASSADNFFVRQNITGSNILATGAITAQTLVVQTVTSSIVYSSGSNIFGNQLTDTQRFTGSMFITGSTMNVNGGSICATQNMCIGGMGIVASCLGIGTSSPSTALHISSSTTQITLQNNAGGTNARRIGMNMTSGDTFKILSLCDNNTTRVDNIIVANVLSGNVGIGTSSPSGKLDVSGSLGNFYIGTSGAELFFTRNENNDFLANAGSSAGIRLGAQSYLRFDTGTTLTERMRITSDGVVSINCNGSFGKGAKLQILQGSSNTNALDFKNTDATYGHIGTFANNLYLTQNYYYAGGQNNDSATYGQAAITMGVSSVAGDTSIDFSMSDPGATSPNSKMRLFSVGCGVLLVGTTTCTAEASLVLGAKGTNEGGQLVLQKGTSCSCATHLDNYQNQFRIMSGTDTSSTTVNVLVDHAQRFLAVGRTSPFSVFGDSNGIVQYGDGSIYAAASNTEALGLSRIGTDGAVAIFRRSTTTVGSICVTSSTTSFNTSSDYRLKTDLKSFNGVCLIARIKPYDFKWKVNCDRMYGFIAHELAEVLPYVVSGEKDGEEMQSLDYSKLTPVLVKAIQEQQCQICTQSIIIDQLKTCLGII